MRVDLNADAGESFGPWTMGRDSELFDHLTSVNLACGFHAGDPLTMHRAVQLARERGVAVGAHPGFPDRVGFGRRDMAASPDEVYADVLYQVGALHGMLKLHEMTLHHVKPHGALYLKMMRDPDTARSVAQAVKDYGEGVPLVVLGGAGGDAMTEAAGKVGIEMVLEAFPDRAYLQNGHLAPRRLKDAVIHDPTRVAERAVAMVTKGEVEALDGGTVRITAQTLCIHGDNLESPETAQAVREALQRVGVEVVPF